jgi:Rod binding domain-containing protein
MIDRIESGEAKPGHSQDDVRNKLKHTCQEFESLFITYLLKSQETLSVENSFFGKNKIIQAMFHENLAKDIAASGGMGLGDMLFERFEK